MALNCGGRPPDPAPPAGYLLIKKGSDNKLPIESSQQVATTTMFGSGTSTPHENILTGSGAASCINSHVGSKSNDDYKGVCLSSGGFDSYVAGGSCTNNIIGVAAAKMGVDQYYYRHHEMEGPLVQLQMGYDHHQLQGVVEGVGVQHQQVVGVQHQQVAAAAGGYAHIPGVGSTHDIAQIGSTISAAQLRVGATHHDMELSSALQLQGKSAASQLLGGANNCCNTKELARSHLPQPAAAAAAAATDHHRTYYDMSLKMTVQLQRQDVDAPDRHRSLQLGEYYGETVHHHNKREGDTAAGRGQLQYMKLSPEGSSMMSVEEQEGLYYGGSSLEGGGGGAGENMQMSTWEQYNMQAQEGQSMMMMMKKRRLTNEQVKSLEVSFERESKLEAERKKELAQELGLQPRQVAVWFQNRRARFKTKQLERDFDLLKHQYDVVRSEKDKLLAEVAKLKGLLDAQTATSKGKFFTRPAHDAHDDMDEDKKVQQLMSPESPEKQKATEATLEGTRKLQNATAEAAAARTGKQKATSNQKVQSYKQQQQHGDVLSSEKSDHATILAMDQPPAKGSFTLEVKPSLQVPHVDHYYYQQQAQQQFPNTLSPPTKLSLCSPQQLFLHHMVAMKMEGNNFNLAQYEPHSNLNYNDHYNFQDEEDGRESMLCFNSTWNHDP